MSSVIFVKRGKTFHAVDEIVDEHNTQSVCNLIKEKWPNHKIVVYPDASGGSDHTSASQSDIEIMRKYGFECRIKGEIRGKSIGKNPRIKDRVNAVNNSFEKGFVKVNYTSCPRTSECLSQQSFDKNGMPDKSGGTDHMVDGFGYCVNYNFPIRKPVSVIKAVFPV